MTPYQVAERLQSRFRFSEDGEVIECKDRHVSDILGSDWAKGVDYSGLSASEYYNVVRFRAEKKHGELPF